MSADILAKLHTFITTEILNQPDKKLEATQPLLSSGIVDSFSLIDISLFVEETFDVEIDNTELNVDHFDTLEQLAKLIKDRM
jgi:acyl carrier protein